MKHALRLFCLRVLAGYSRLVGGRMLLLPIVFVVVWAVIFAVVFPLMWVASWATHEWMQVGSMSAEFPRSCGIVTLVTGAGYLRGARVLGCSLQMHLSRDLPMIALTSGLSDEQEKSLRLAGWKVRHVEPIPFRPEGKTKEQWRWEPEEALATMHVNALTKMRAWEMEEFERLIFIDSDTWVVGDVSDLCRRTEEMAGMGGESGADVNSGVMSFRPSKARFKDMMHFWENEPEKLLVYNRRGRLPNELINPDQSLIVSYCRERHIPIGPLSSRYNLNCRAARDANTKILHFNVNAVKPWSFDKSKAQNFRDAAKRDGNEMDVNVWGYVMEWLDLESRCDKATSAS